MWDDMVWLNHRTRYSSGRCVCLDSLKVFYMTLEAEGKWREWRKQNDSADNLNVFIPVIRSGIRL